MGKTWSFTLTLPPLSSWGLCPMKRHNRTLCSSKTHVPLPCSTELTAGLKMCPQNPRYLAVFPVIFFFQKKHTGDISQQIKARRESPTFLAAARGVKLAGNHMLLGCAGKNVPVPLLNWFKAENLNPPSLSPLDRRKQVFFMKLLGSKKNQWKPKYPNCFSQGQEKAQIPRRRVQCWAGSKVSKILPHHRHR